MAIAPISIASLLLLCPPVGEPPSPDELHEAQRQWANGPASAPETAAAGLPPSIVGQWSAPRSWPVTAIHALLLPSGDVLHYSYPSGTPGSKAMVWNPRDDEFTEVSMNSNLFCSGHTIMPDGTVYVTGGTDPGCDFTGHAGTYIFDPVTNTWTPNGDMADGRWYPSNIVLGDGRVLVTTGLDQTCDTNAEMELYTPGVGLSWVPEGHRYLQLYPRLHLLSTGVIAHVGPEHQAFTFELGVGWAWAASTLWGWRSQGTSVLLPNARDRIMIMGGGNSEAGVTNTCEIIDFSERIPQYAYAAPMNHPRAHFDALILPDGTIFACGGGTVDLYGSPINTPELYDPVANTWTELSPHVYGRMYHATTILLPDGRVIVAGQDNGDSPFWGEIYEPPYLFRGARPVLESAPEKLIYGQSFSFVTPDANSIDAVALVKLSSVTHSVNFQQRHVGLDFTVMTSFPTDGGGAGVSSLAGTLDDNPNLAPPGFYMLFLLNDQGVPSIGEIIKVGPALPEDVNMDGLVNVDDLVAVVLAWGPCPGCPEDVNLDGFVNVDDIVAVVLAWGSV